MIFHGGCGCGRRRRFGRCFVPFEHTRTHEVADPIVATGVFGQEFEEEIPDFDRRPRRRMYYEE